MLNITSFEKKHFSEGRRKADPTIRVTVNKLSISSYAVKLMGLKPKDRVIIHQDNEDPRIWYLTKETKGFDLCPVGKTSALLLYNTKLAKMILEAFEVEENNGFTYQVMPESVNYNGAKYWKLIPQEDI